MSAASCGAISITKLPISIRAVFSDEIVIFGSTEPPPTVASAAPGVTPTGLPLGTVAGVGRGAMVFIVGMDELDGTDDLVGIEVSFGDGDADGTGLPVETDVLVGTVVEVVEVVEVVVVVVVVSATANLETISLTTGATAVATA